MTNTTQKYTFIVEANEDYVCDTDLLEALQIEFNIDEISVENLGGAFEVEIYSSSDLDDDDTLRRVQDVADELSSQGYEPDFGNPYAGRGYSSLGEAEELRTKRKTHI